MLANLIILLACPLLYSFAGVSSEAESQRIGTNSGQITLQKLFLDVLSGKEVGPSGDRVVDPKFELNRTLVAVANERTPIKGIFQGSAAPCVPIARDLLTKETNDTYVVLVRAARLRPLINLGLWTCAVMHTTLYTPSMQKLSKPSFLELLPYRSLPLPVINTAINQAGTGKECPLTDDRYGVVNGINNRLWYFRDDAELNVQHWFWHLSYPYYELQPVRRDRRGELFYYFHQQLLARYNAERLANDLSIIKSFKVSSKSVIAEAYLPYISHRYTGQYWPSREANTNIDFNGQNGENIPEYVAKINAAIDFKALKNINGDIIKLTNTAGIDLLGDVVESSVYSIDRMKYGQVHNLGHVLISQLGNITGKFYGAMLDLATSIRDPAFFRWHSFINDIFQRHKRLLNPYLLVTGENKLVWKGVHVDVVTIHSNSGPGSATTLNSLETLWSYRQLDISRTVNPVQPGSSTIYNGRLPVCLKYLNHRPFQYHITISSSFIFAKATIRIFLAPRYNLDGKSFELKDQRIHFALLDTFTTKLSLGVNFIKRRSKDSTLTRPFQKPFSQLEREVGKGHVKKPICGCGLPHNLLLPRGTEAGMTFDLFIMVTNGEQDSDGNLGDQSTNFCTAPYHWCGRFDQTYPDKKPMGYPFDRLPPFTATGRRVKNIEKYAELIPNSKTVQVIITHNNRIKMELLEESMELDSFNRKMEDEDNTDS